MVKRSVVSNGKIMQVNKERQLSLKHIVYSLFRRVISGVEFRENNLKDDLEHIQTFPTYV